MREPNRISGLQQFPFQTAPDSRERAATSKGGRPIRAASGWALALWPLLEHLGYGILNQLLVLGAIVGESILGDAAPEERLRLRVKQIDDQGSYDILLGS